MAAMVHARLRDRLPALFLPSLERMSSSFSHRQHGGIASNNVSCKQVHGGWSESSLSNSRRFSSIKGLGCYISSASKHVDAMDTRGFTDPSTQYHFQIKQVACIPECLDSHAGNECLPNCSGTEGKTSHSVAGFLDRRGLCREPSRMWAFSDKSCSLHTSSDTWLAQHRLKERRCWLLDQTRDLVTTAQSLKATSTEQVPAPGTSDVHDNVGGWGQPPPSQPLERSLLPTSPEEEKIAPILAQPDLLITRNVEWANLALGFEQQNKYVIMDPHQPQAPVGFIIENSNVFLRQVMRTRRPFTASVLDANGEEVCLVVGECHRRWHLWKRKYDVYVGNKQFAAVENPGFWHWTFTLKNENGGVLAEIDRNWRGFGYEFLTDAGQYVVRFGDVLPKGNIHHATPVIEEGDRKPFISSMSEKTGAGEMKELQEAAKQAEALVVTRPLTLTERAVALALAVSLDNDYFSRHSQSGMDMLLPIPFHSSEASTADHTTSSDPGRAGETGYEVFPREHPPSENTAADAEIPSATDESTFAEDPVFGMFDEPSDKHFAEDQFIDDPAEKSGDSGWGLDDWGFGDGD